MATSLDWSQAIASFLETENVEPVLEAYLTQFISNNPVDVFTAIPGTESSVLQNEAGNFFLHLINTALEDHALCDEEMLVLRHMLRLLRKRRAGSLDHLRGES